MDKYPAREHPEQGPTSSQWPPDRYDETLIDAPAITAETDQPASASETEHSLVALQEAFTPYKDEVLAISQELEACGDNPEAMSNHIDSGSEVDVFWLPEHTGIVVKLPHTDIRGEAGLEHMRERAKIMVAGLGIPHVEQIVAYNDDPALLALLSTDEGQRTLRRYHVYQRERIPSEHFATLISTYQIMYENGIRPDDSTSNIIYDSEKGFTIIDYTWAEGKTVTDTVIKMADTDMLLSGIYSGNPVPDYALRFRDVCGDMLGGEVADKMNKLWLASGHRPRW